MFLWGKKVGYRYAHIQSYWIYVNSPESHNNGWGLCTCCDESNDEEKYQKWNECIAGAITFPRHSITIFMQIGLDNNHSELAALTHCGWSDYLSTLDTGTFSVISYLQQIQEERDIFDIFINKCAYIVVRVSCVYVCSRHCKRKSISDEIRKIDKLGLLIPYCNVLLG